MLIGSLGSYCVYCSFLFIAGLLPVVSWVLIDKSLIINTIHFCWFAGIFRWGGVVSVIDIVSFVDRHTVFILSLLFISGFADYLPVFSCVFGVNSLIINVIHFSGM